MSDSPMSRREYVKFLEAESDMANDVLNNPGLYEACAVDSATDGD